MHKEQIGTVTSDKMAKTRVVSVERLVQHSFYHKTMKRQTKFYAHDERNVSKTGDKVRIRESRPLSRTKRWTVVEVMKNS